jgi:dCTP deaminase
MTILCDRSIRKLCESDTPMIAPFVGEQVRAREDGQKIISYGLSSAGYDVRLGNKFKIFTNALCSNIDPLDLDPNMYVDYEGEYCWIPPNSYILGHTMEVFNIPKDVLAICLGKSTYARLASIVNVTPIEPEFKGDVVIEIANLSPLPLKVYAGMGIAQFLFLKMDEECEVSYNDRGGKYQGQRGLTTARL